MTAGPRRCRSPPHGGTPAWCSPKAERRQSRLASKPSAFCWLSASGIAPVRVWLTMNVHPACQNVNTLFTVSRKSLPLSRLAMISLMITAVTPSPPEGWQWDETLYLGSAPYYVRGRPPYAPGLADALKRILALDGQGRLLDVGCGPGIVTLPLAHLFTEAVGLDPDPGMLAEGARRAADAGIGNITWVRARAEGLAGGPREVPCGDLCPVLPLDGSRPRGGASSSRCSSRVAPWSTSATSRETGRGIAPTQLPHPLPPYRGDS